MWISPEAQLFIYLQEGKQDPNLPCDLKFEEGRDDWADLEISDHVFTISYVFNSPVSGSIITGTFWLSSMI